MQARRIKHQGKFNSDTKYPVHLSPCLNWGENQQSTAEKRLVMPLIHYSVSDCKKTLIIFFYSILLVFLKKVIIIKKMERTSLIIGDSQNKTNLTLNITFCKIIFIILIKGAEWSTNNHQIVIKNGDMMFSHKVLFIKEKFLNFEYFPNISLHVLSSSSKGD